MSTVTADYKGGRYLLLAGIGLAALADAIAGTALGLGRAHIMGDTHASPDEGAWLDVAYTALKIIGFIATPWLMTRIVPHRLVLGATIVLGAACAITVMTTSLEAFVALRGVQGLAGGVLLVAGQALIILVYPRQIQPTLQAIFAGMSVVTLAAVAPGLQGWLIDAQSWIWIFVSVVPITLIASGFVVLGDDHAPVTAPVDTIHTPFDGVGFGLLATALGCITYVLNQGSRWNWFEAAHIAWLSAIGAGALLVFLAWALLGRTSGLIDFSPFRSNGFAFAFAVSFVAGAALFGSAYLIPAFAVSVLGFSPTGAGQLLLPSGALFILALSIAAVLIQRRRAPPAMTIPFGILAIMIAMWMLSGSIRESGATDMMPAVLLRGFGLGLLFLSITLIAFGGLDSRALASGIALFNTGRQLGGLMGVAGLQTLIDHNIAANMTALGAGLSAGSAAVGERLAATAALLTAKGLDVALAGRAAAGLLGGGVRAESTVIAFETAFNAIALMFVFAAPCLITFRVALARYSRSTAK